MNDRKDATENKNEDCSSVDSENEGSQSGHPLETIPAIEIQNAIISALLKCPNRSCTLQSVTSRVLREMTVRTRGGPRAKFEKRVMQSVDYLEECGRIEKYTSKNQRIKLINSMTPSG